MKNFLTIIPLIFFQMLFAQENKLPIKSYRYDQDLLPKEFHAQRREALRKILPEKSVSIFFSNPVRNRSNDVDYEYHQNPNLYYLTGHLEPHSVLFIFKDSLQVNGARTNEIFLTPPRDSASELWTGRILGPTDAKEILGIGSVYSNEIIDSMTFAFATIENILFENFPVAEDDPDSDFDLFDLENKLKNRLAEKKIAFVPSKSIRKAMAQLREIKQPEEIKIMRRAIDLSCEAHNELIRSLHLGMNEYQAQSILEYKFKNGGGESIGYPSIVGGNENACVLHYTLNRKPLYETDLLLVDAGAEYHGYTADITRTLPISGTFSKAQKEIYEIVLAAQEAGIKKCLSGKPFNSAHLEAVKVIGEGLKKLGIIKKESEYKSYFMHGTSHYLGLDVHDAGLRDELKPGNIITVEPGIYIPEGSSCDPKWWNIGIRIEDDILITDHEPEVLSGSIPRKVNEIEDLMKEIGYFEK